ncbi:MAG TPA: type II secretion system protein GspG [Thermoanaerobaculia bacterium]|jgi:general secretion pathway protein G
MAFCAWCGNPVAAVSYAACPRCGNPVNGSQRVAGSGNDGAKSAGIVVGLLVGGIVLVAILGILAAIAIPNFLTAMNRSKQKRTMADMRSVAAAAEAYATDENKYPDPSDLQSALVPKYMRALPTDGWENPLRYECWPAGACSEYAIGSAGADRAFQHDSLQQYSPEKQTGGFDDDLVLVNGKWMQSSEGVQNY